MKHLITAGIISIVPTLSLAQPSDADLLSFIAAVEAVEREVPGHIIEAEMDLEKERFIYEMEVVEKNNVSTVKLDARSGEIISINKSWLENTWRDIWGSKHYNLLNNVTPLSETLKQLKEASTGQIHQVEFDVEGGTPVYEIEIVSDAGKADIYINAKTGERLPAGFID